MAVVALAVALAGSLGLIAWLTRRLVSKTEYAAKVEIEKLGAFYSKQVKDGLLLTANTRVAELERALVAVQEKLADALEELHEVRSKELVGAAPGDVAGIVSGMLEKRAARRAVSRASGHSAEPVAVQPAGAASVGEITDLK